MGTLQELAKTRKDKIIQRLLEENHFKIGDLHLYELTLSELEHVYDLAGQSIERKEKL